ncbi:MAG: tryptophan synthase subunit alpha [bacterium]
MKRLELDLRERRTRRPLLVAYVTAGYPDEERFLELLPLLEQQGVDAVEIGLPCSDPLADGPVIQQASADVLAAGMTTQRALELAARLSETMTIPLLAMGYLNPLLAHSLPRFLEEAEAAGLSGLIIPDLPLGADPLREQLLAGSPLARIQLATPASTEARLAKLAQQAEGFIYVVSRMGVTGGLSQGDPALAAVSQSLRSLTTLPLLTGFGIADPASAALAMPYGDGVIVGSALLQLLQDGNESLDAALQFIAGIRRELDRSALTAAGQLKESLR